MDISAVFIKSGDVVKASSAGQLLLKVFEYVGAQEIVDREGCIKYKPSLLVKVNDVADGGYIPLSDGVWSIRSDKYVCGRFMDVLAFMSERLGVRMKVVKKNVKGVVTKETIYPLDDSQVPNYTRPACEFRAGFIRFLKEKEISEKTEREYVASLHQVGGVLAKNYPELMVPDTMWHPFANEEIHRIITFLNAERYKEEKSEFAKILGKKDLSGTAAACAYLGDYIQQRH